MLTRTQEQFTHFKGTAKLYGPTLKAFTPILEVEVAHTHETRYLSEAIVKAMEAKRPKKAYRVKNGFLLS
jgi:hypothetical protein